MFWNKFVKAAITSGIASVAVALGVGVSVHTLEQLKNLAVLLVMSFCVGAFHGLWAVLYPPLP